MKKQVGIAAINKRMKDIIDVFDVNSEVYKKASHFFEANVEDKYLKKDEKGNIIGIRQTKEAKADPNLLGLHPEGLNEYVPSVTELFKEQRDALLEKINGMGDIMGPRFDVSLLQGSGKELVSDPRTKKYIASEINKVFEDLNNVSGMVHDVYQVRDNKLHLNDADYTANDYRGRALTIIDNLRDKGRTREWIREARQLVDDYQESVNEQTRKRIRERYGK